MTLPDELVDRIFAGEHPVRIWRAHCGLTVNELASRAGIPPRTLKRIEGRSRIPEDDAERLAKALEIHPCELQRFPGQFRGCEEAMAAAPQGQAEVDALKRSS